MSNLLRPSKKAGPLASGWIAPKGLGYTFMVAQALVVAAFAEL